MNVLKWHKKGAGNLPAKSAGSAIAVILGTIAIWQGISAAARIPALPGPYEIALASGRVAPALGLHMLVSMWRVVAGSLIALSLGVPLGCFVGRNRTIDTVIAPVIYLAYPVPKIAFLPVILLFLGLGDTSKIFIIVLLVFFQIFVSTRDAARNLPPSLVYSVKALGATPRDIYRHAIIPAILPEIFTATRIGLGTGLATLFFTETFATFHGLGYFIMDAWSRAAYDEMFAGIMALSILGFVLFAALDIIERRTCRWKHLN
ncbi:MAG: ABC transporter permease [Firmicutes bacterium]|nr:ABC transporter permease [Bacillota bacterium]